MTVPLASLSNITKLVETIAQHLSANTAARLSLAPNTSTPTAKKRAETPPQSRATPSAATEIPSPLKFATTLLRLL